MGEALKEQFIQDPETTQAKLREPTDYISSRQSSELVIAICGAVGAGASTVSEEIKKQFKSINYTVSTIKISQLITEIQPLSQECSKYDRIKELQLAGSKIRDEKGKDYLAQLAITKIVQERISYTADKVKKNEADINYGRDARIDRRHVTIIDSLKNPHEVILLQKVYGNMFYMFGVLCNDAKRKKRLEDKGMSESQAADLMERDKKQKEKHGQQLQKTLQHSDFFTRNDEDNVNISLQEPIKRFINLLLGKKDITPTNEEFGMYLAESSARRSGCLSRQVGAAILTSSGDIVSLGRNDVPKANGGGLYNEEDGRNDARCFKKFDHACANHKGKTGLYSKLQHLIKGTLSEHNLEQPIVTKDGKSIAPVEKQLSDLIIEKLQEESEINDLLEYCRAVHAEMDAITTAARNGTHSLKGTILFSTTFPCHHCARHIVASGIKTVYYIEPYDKSLATKLHDDSILLGSQTSKGEKGEVIFLHFEGVAPKRYLDLFSCNDRKKDGTLIEVDLQNQKPTAVLLLDTFLEYESKVVKYVKETSGEQEEK